MMLNSLKLKNFLKTLYNTLYMENTNHSQLVRFCESITSSCEFLGRYMHYCNLLDWSVEKFGYRFIWKTLYLNNNTSYASFQCFSYGWGCIYFWKGIDVFLYLILCDTVDPSFLSQTLYTAKTELCLKV